MDEPGDVDNLLSSLTMGNQYDGDVGVEDELDLSEMENIGDLGDVF